MSRLENFEVYMLANEAGLAASARIPDRPIDGEMNCWINVKKGYNLFAEWLLESNLGKVSPRGGVDLEINSEAGKSGIKKEVYGLAFCRLLVDNGVDCSVNLSNP